MDDLYAINFVKTEFREAFNSGNAERLITLLDPEFVYMPDGVGQTMGEAAVETIREQFRDLAGFYHVQLLPIVIEIRLQDSIAYDYGWHIWKKTRGADTEPVIARERYRAVPRPHDTLAAVTPAP